MKLFRSDVGLASRRRPNSSKLKNFLPLHSKNILSQPSIGSISYLAVLILIPLPCSSFFSTRMHSASHLARATRTPFRSPHTPSLRKFIRPSAPPMDRTPSLTVHSMMPLNPQDVKGVIEAGKALYKEVAPKPSYNGVFSLLILNLGLFALDKLLGISGLAALYLNHAAPQWFQFITCTFMHANWQHISSNIFMIYVFGKIVEEEGGPLGVWLTYLICGLGGSIAAFLLTPAVKSAGILGLAKATTVTLGASGAVFGLFVTSVLLKLQFNNWRKILEAVILGNFVVQQIWQEVRSQVAVGAASNISHVAHLGGAAAGVLLILLLGGIAGSGPKDRSGKSAVKAMRKYL